MVNELEKQFFDTFGIQTLCSGTACNSWGDCVGCLHYPNTNDYPKITDAILFELLCIIGRNLCSRFGVDYDNSQQLKEKILEELIVFIHTPYYHINHKTTVKKQVQKLFKKEDE